MTGEAQGLVIPHPSARALAGGLYAAKLLFEFCVRVNGRPKRRRLCEERIILINAPGALAALAAARRQGKAAQHCFENADGRAVLFRFVGVLGLVHLGIECAPNEVWYALETRMSPMERRATLIPPKDQLSAFRQEALVLPPKGRAAGPRAGGPGTWARVVGQQPDGVDHGVSGRRSRRSAAPHSRSLLGGSRRARRTGCSGLSPACGGRSRGLPGARLDARQGLGSAAIMRRERLRDHAGLPAEELAQLEAVSASHHGLDDIFAWGRLQSPVIVPLDVIKQDEFTHDVLVPLPSGRWLVYGTT